MSTKPITGVETGQIKLNDWTTGTPLVRLGKRWLEPRSTNRDEAFRERTIRITVSIVFVACALAFLSSRLVFRYEWTLVSYSTMILVALLLSLASAIAVNNGRILLAGWLLLTTFI